MYHSPQKEYGKKRTMNGSLFSAFGRFFNSVISELDWFKNTFDPSSRTTSDGRTRKTAKREPHIIRMKSAMYVPSRTVPVLLPFQLSTVGMMEPTTAPMDQIVQKSAM